MSEPLADSVTPAQVIQRMPEVARILALIDEPITQEFLDAFARNYGASFLADLVVPGKMTSKNFVRRERTATSREYRELFELLALEHVLCSDPHRIAVKFRTAMQLDKTVHILRQSIASTLSERARELASRQPLTSVRILRVADRYLSEVCTHAHLSRDESAVRFEARLGVGRVLQARYVDVGSEVLQSAAESLRNSIRLGNDADSAQAYLSECLLRLGDATGDRALYVEVARTEQVRLPGHRLAVAEAFLRLSQFAESEASRRGFLERARQEAERVQGDPVIFTRRNMICALAQVAKDSPLPFRWMRLPFGLKAHMRSWAEEDSRAAELALGRLVDSLSSGAYRLPNVAFATRILGSLMSLQAGMIEASVESAKMLELAIRTRSQVSSRGDAEGQLEDALDGIALFRHRGRPTQLVSACASLVKLAEDASWPTPVLVLAQVVADHGEMFTPSVAFQLRRDVGENGNVIAGLVMSRDVQALHRLAADRALKSTDVEHRHLGGRFGVFRASDYTGLLADSFVFKPTMAGLADREDTRARRIGQHLGEAGLLHRFGVPKTLARSEVKLDASLAGADHEVVVARQFHAGRLLSELNGGVSEVAREAFRATAEYLAIIHAIEGYDGIVEFGMHRELKKKELGRWLRAGLAVDDPAGTFAAWWDIVQDLPAVPRRDSHAHNWIITPKNKVIAVDLEAHGWRPVGYELAQLTDDVPVFAVSPAGLRTRWELLERYRRTLRSYGVLVSARDLRIGYEAGLAARSVRILTEPDPHRTHQQHAEALLTYLKEKGRLKEIRSFAHAVSTAWQARRGYEGSPQVSRRRHLSRAMAYHLRHGDDVMVDDHGWGYLASISDALHRQGLETDKHELRLVATAIDEPRFEVEGNRVRALYGHSRRVRIDHPPATFSGPIYHGTATRNVNRILQESEGLRPMKRHWVHFTTNPEAAIRTARRHGAYIVLETSAGEIGGLGAASRDVLVAEAVPPSLLKILTPSQAFLFNLRG